MTLKGMLTACWTAGEETDICFAMEGKKHVGSTVLASLRLIKNWAQRMPRRKRC